MPCQGPSEAECREMKADENFRIYGLRESYADITTRVACLLAKGKSTALTKKWIEEHDKLDKVRAAAIARNRKRKAADAEIAAASKTILKKHGL